MSARVASAPRNDRFGERIRHADRFSISRRVRRNVFYAGEGVANRAVTGAAAKISLEGSGKIVFLFVAQRGGGHDHSRRTVAALKTLRVEKGPLHRMQPPVLGQTLNRRYRLPLGAKGRIKAAVHGLFVRPRRYTRRSRRRRSPFSRRTSRDREERRAGIARDRRRRRETPLPFTVRFTRAAPDGSARVMIVKCRRCAGEPCTSSRYRFSGIAASIVSRRRRSRSANRRKRAARAASSRR